MLFLESEDLILRENSVTKQISKNLSTIKSKSGDALNSTKDKLNISNDSWDKLIKEYETQISKITNINGKLKLKNELDDELDTTDKTIVRIDKMIKLYDEFPQRIKFLKLQKKELKNYISVIKRIKTKLKNKKVEGE